MKDPQSPIVFDKARASSYDKQFAKLAPMKDALHLLMRMVLCELGNDARLLCVGVGTGTELMDLAAAHPHWQFTAVEPAAPMLDICRRRAEERGVAARCTFHEGYLDSLPESEPFDAATSILVSHFIVDPEERRDFFRQIAVRLRPGALFVSADLASDTSTPAYKSLFDLWSRTLRYSEIPAEKVDKLCAGLGNSVAVVPPEEIESMLESSGFHESVLFFQTVLLHAWYSKTRS